jgi:O-antigen/teichoic acid export membrane protein
MSNREEGQPVSGIRLALVNGSWQSLTNLYYLVVRSIFVVVFARIIGVEHYGYYVYAQYWYVLVLPVATWGMNELLMAEYARTVPERRSELIGAGLSLRLILSTVVTVLVMVGACLFEPDATLRLLIIIYAQGVLANGLTNWFSSLFVAREKSHYVLYLSAPLLTLEVVLIVFAANRGVDLLTIALLQCGIWWFTFLAGYLVYRHRFEPIRLRFSREYNRHFLRNGAVLAVAAFVFSCFGPGLLILYRYLIENVEQIGGVALVMQVFIILSQAIKVVSNSALPQLNRVSANAGGRQAFFAITIWKQSLYLGGAGFLLCYCLLVPVVTSLIGAEFGAAADMFARNCWLVIPLTIVHGLRLILISNRMMHLFLFATIAGLLTLVTLIMSLYVTDKMEPSDLFAVLGLSYGLVAMLMMVFMQKKQKIFASPDFLFPLVLLATTLLLFFNTGGKLSVAVGSMALLLAASVVDLKLRYQRLIDGIPGR